MNMNMLNKMNIVLNNVPQDVSIPQFDKLISVLTALAIGIGGIWLLMEVIFFGISFSSSDQSQKTHALLRMAGAFIVLSAGTIYQLLK